jgi:KaiC/GvpD/RAD55 family RecA-like ATPase
MPGIELPEVVPASRLVDRPPAATVLTGIEPLDALTGGLPRGGLTEICGPASSGRTSALLALMSSMTAQGELCALVDASDSFDPKSGSAAGVDLRRLLWVRCSRSKSIVDGGRSMASGQWSVGSGQSKSQTANRKSQMDSLEQALKATDLLLQGGGFGLVVVDLGDVPAQAARRVPLTSWFRFRRAVENTRTVLLVLEQEPYAKTCASVVVKLSAVSSQQSASGQWSEVGGQQKDEPAHARILSGLQITAEILRSATQGKKPVGSAGARFASRAEWAQVKNRIG